MSKDTDTRFLEQTVTVRGLRKSYGGRVVVDGVNFDVAAGEVLGLIGANGAGKTTTVECLQGLRRPDEGLVRVLGLDPVTDADRLRPLIVSQLQDSALPDRLRVQEAMAVGSHERRHRLGSVDRRYDLHPRGGRACPTAVRAGRRTPGGAVRSR